MFSVVVVSLSWLTAQLKKLMVGASILKMLQLHVVCYPCMYRAIFSTSFSPVATACHEVHLILTLVLLTSYPLVKFKIPKHTITFQICVQS